MSHLTTHNLPRNTSHERHATKSPSTTVENPLQISPFMQNKPNFQKSQMNLNPYNTTDYEIKSNWTLGENKPNSNPIKPNCRKGKIDAKRVFTKDYRKNDDFEIQKNKPNLFKGPK